MKKALIVIGIIITLVVVAALVLPVIYKDDIKAKIDSEVAKSVNAHVFYDVDKFSISMFRDFPNFTLSAGDFGIVGKDEFKGDTLTSIKEFNVVVDLMSVISGNQLKINGIYLNTPRIFAKVLKNGKASWDIAKPDTTTTPDQTTKEEKSSFAIKIKEWKIENGYVLYHDKLTPTFAEIAGLNHTGSGDITQDVFEIMTKTSVQSLTVQQAGTNYLSKNKFEAELNLAIDNKAKTYTFKENEFELNDFAFGFDGTIGMPDTSNIDLNLTFGVKKTEFKNIISLIPGVFLKGYEDLKTSGTLALTGFAKGRYNKTRMPAFGLNLKIDKGSLQYPKLPAAVKNVVVDLVIDNKDGVLDHTSVNLNKFHVDFGNNPVDATLKLMGLTNYNIDATLKAKLNLGDITSMFPVEGTSLKGVFALDAKAKGIYNGTQMPSVAASMSLVNGFVKSSSFPAALDKFEFNGTVNNATGKMADTKVAVDNFAFVMDGDPFQGKMSAENFDDINYFLEAKGIIDLTKMTKIFPLEGMTLSGLINVADFKTSGKMSDVTAGNYGKLPTSGDMTFTNFAYLSADLPQGFKMTKGILNFTPEKMNIKQMDGFLGKSDISVNGFLSNYIGYMFSGGTVKGKMNFNSTNFDVNEWMVDAPASTTAPVAKPDSNAKISALEIPKNIDFVLSSDMKKVKYDNMNIENLKGDIIVKEGTVKMSNILFNLLGGNFKTNGTYDAKDIANPKFDFDLDIKNLQFKDAYSTFNTVKAFAPLAQNLDGKFNTTFKVSGDLGQDMMPVMNKITGNGIMNIAQTTIKGLALTNSISSITKFSGMKDLTLKDVALNFEIRDGRVYIKKPITLSSGTTGLVVQSGSQGLDNTMDYIMKMDIPAGAAGAAANSAIGSLTGKPVAAGGKIKLNLGVTGTSTSPKVKILGGETSDQVTAVKTAVVDKAKEEATKLKNAAEAKAMAEAARLKAEADAKVAAEKKRLEDEAKKKAASEGKKLLKGFGL
jgi:uncharacterized protein involved in outer membrane biogenesis